MKDIYIKLIITFLLLYEVAPKTQSAVTQNPYDVNLNGSIPTRRISYKDDVLPTLDGSEPDDKVLSWTWTITTDGNMRLQVTFEQGFNLRPVYSILEFGDGAQPGDDLYGESYTKLAGFSGSDRPSPIISLTNSLWIRFKYLPGKDKWQYDFTMAVNWVQAGVMTVGAGKFELSSDNPTASITSPSYPNKYPSNYYRLWTVHAIVGSTITVSFEEFDVGSSKNHRLMIADTTHRFLNGGGGQWTQWTGKKPNDDVFGIFNYQSETSSIYVLFTASYKPGGKGFSLQLRANFATTPHPTTSTFAPSTTTDIKSCHPTCTCVCPSTTTTNSTTTMREATGGSHPGSTGSHSNDAMQSSGKPRACPIKGLFDLKTILVFVIVALVLIFISVCVGCYCQRRMNVNKLMITIKEKPNCAFRSRVRTAVKPVRKLGSDIGDGLCEENECATDIIPYGPIYFGRPSSGYISFKDRVDDFGYQLTETMLSGNRDSAYQLIHTYFDMADRRIAEFSTFDKIQPYEV